MSRLIRWLGSAELVDDAYVTVTAEEPLPPSGALIVPLERWQSERDRLVGRNDPLGVWLRSDQHPEALAADLTRLAVVALEFPRFRDGRAYTYARLLRERFAYRGELRAVGDVLVDQLHLMLRAGFDAFELAHPDPLRAFERAVGSMSIFYQPAADGAPAAFELRRQRITEAGR